MNKRDKEMIALLNELVAAQRELLNRYREESTITEPVAVTGIPDFNMTEKWCL